MNVASDCTSYGTKIGHGWAVRGGSTEEPNLRKSGRKVLRPDTGGEEADEPALLDWHGAADEEAIPGCAFAAQWRRPSRGGSHVIFSAPGVREIVSVPAKRPIKAVYVRQFLALVDAAGVIGTR